MNDANIEQTLSRFKFKAPQLAARAQILTAAHTAWDQTPQTESVWAWRNWRWPTYYAAAAAVLLLLNGVVTSLDQRWTTDLIAETAPALDERQTAFEQLCIELGRDPKIARQLWMLAARPAPKGDINEFLRQKNQLLQATELL